MKKTFLTLSFLGLILLNQSCNKNESNVKIDFTKSYEDAAMALSNAQKNYNEALASNNPAEIEAARKQLEEAQTKYIAAKDTYISGGGKVNADYENVLTSTKESLEKSKEAVSDLGNAAAAATETKATNAVSQTAEKINGSIEKAGAKINEIKDKAAADKAKVDNAVKNTKTNIQQTNDNLKKTAEDTKENLNKTKQDLKNIFK